MAGLTLAVFLQKASSHPRSIRSFTSVVHEAYPFPDAVPAPPGGFGFAPNGIAAYSPVSLTLSSACLESTKR